MIYFYTIKRIALNYKGVKGGVMNKNRIIITSATILFLFLFFTPQGEGRPRDFSNNLNKESSRFGILADFQNPLVLKSYDGLESEESSNYTPVAFKSINFYSYNSIGIISSENLFLAPCTTYSGSSQRPPPLLALG